MWVEQPAGFGFLAPPSWTALPRHLWREPVGIWGTLPKLHAGSSPTPHREGGHREGGHKIPDPVRRIQPNSTLRRPTTKKVTPSHRPGASDPAQLHIEKVDTENVIPPGHREGEHRILIPVRRIQPSLHREGGRREGGAAAAAAAATAGATVQQHRSRPFWFTVAASLTCRHQRTARAQTA